MKNDWPTKEQDLQVARSIMEEYAKNVESESIGLFELVVDPEEKKLDFRLANWVLAIAYHFNSLYGAQYGETITRRIITKCLTQGQTLH